MEGRESASTISLPDLVALNEEMAALVRSGIPLEQGLVDLGREFPGQLGVLAAQLGRRLQSWESLGRILEENSTSRPPVWTATVAAGIRSGRLAAVLESLAASGRRVAEMRRTIGAALVYPMIVVALAYAVFVLLVTYLAPILAGAFRDLAQSSEPFVTWLAWVGVNTVWWVFWPPAALAALLFVEWLQTRRGFETSDGPVSRLVARVWPGIYRSRRDARLAAFLEILSLLVREQTPLPDALRLAANASGDEGLRTSATTLAERLAGGQTLSSEEVRSLKIPPLLGFMLTTGSHRAGLSDALAANARRYRERSSNAAARTSLVLPIVLTAVVGGSVTLVLALSTIWPIWQLVFRLGA